MNERIEKLDERCGSRSNPDVYDRDQSFDIERFAELIVRECIQNIRDNMEHVRIDTDGDKDLFFETLQKSGHFYITEIKEHFGIAE